MKLKYENILEFNVILQNLAECALSQKAKQSALSLTPLLSERECKSKIDETTQARKIIETFGTPPISSMTELDKILDLAERGAMLIPEQLTGICGFISSCKRMKTYLKKAEELEISLAYYGGSFHELQELYSEIERSIRNNDVEDDASAVLRDLRRKIQNTKDSIKQKLDNILHSKKDFFSDGYVAIRNGRHVLPVKKEYKNQVSGKVIDVSGTGGTYFIEPSAVLKLQEELSLLEIDEDNEVRRILYTLSALVDQNSYELKINKECMETLDFIFAKSKLSIQMKAIPTTISTERKIVIKQGRHPLLHEEICVPLDFEIGENTRGVIITGPNTGGKTVALKTVGLLSLMIQSGLHVPVDEGSQFCMNSNILCDIGDGQSISENLSTFSSHITNIINILKDVTEESLVLLDELGSGTDPAEGMGLAISILDELRVKGCLFVATTHYPEIKDYAKNTKGLINARMEFDKESLKPLYRLQVGEAGESCAFYIAQRLGFPSHMLGRAQKEAYGRKYDFKERNNDFVFKESTEINQTYVKSIVKDIKNKDPRENINFNIGDSVTVYPKKEIGIIFKCANENGELGVQIKGEKQYINHKRLKLLTSAKELYPDDYDFSIIFDSVENRKARHRLNKRHDPNLIVNYDKDLI